MVIKSGLALFKWAWHIDQDYTRNVDRYSIFLSKYNLYTSDGENFSDKKVSFSFFSFWFVLNACFFNLDPTRVVYKLL
jgi:hypothetical protein